MTKPTDITHQRFGRLVAVEYLGLSRWRCLCACGGERIVTGNVLRSGKSKSCGCLRIEMGKARGAASRRHGEGSNGKETPEYAAWGQMKNRCLNPKNDSYRYYGARGIKVCDRWMVYENFLADMGRRPSVLHSIDRIDVHGNYEPGNCRWATSIEQNRNTTFNRRIAARGETKTLAEWLEIVGLRRETFYQRLRRGMSEEEALFTPRISAGRKSQL